MHYNRLILTVVLVVGVHAHTCSAQLLHKSNSQAFPTISEAARADGVGEPIQRDLKVGDRLTVAFVDQAATDYAALLGLDNPGNALGVEIPCRILEIDRTGKAHVKGERVEANFTGMKPTEHAATRMITLEGEVDLTKVRHPTRWYATERTNEFQTLDEMAFTSRCMAATNRPSTIRLSSRANLTLRMWTMLASTGGK